MLQFEDIGSHGTKIIIYNLWLNDESIYELNFDTDDEDIRLRYEANQGSLLKPNNRVLELQSHISFRIRCSLRGKAVEQFNIAADLKHPQTFTYRPQLAGATKEHELITYGQMLRVSIHFMLESGAISTGVLEANFIEPAHDKQDFERSSLFDKLEMRLKQMIMEYWKGHCHLIGHQPEGSWLHNVQRKSAVPARSEVAGMQKHMQTGKSMHEELLVIDLLTASVEEERSIDPSSRVTPIDQICEENVQLFIR